jgi:hypothetical protein
MGSTMAGNSISNPVSNTGNISNPFGSLAADHQQEWLNSGVDAEIVALNVETLVDTASQPHLDSLFPIAERLNWPVTRFGQLGQIRANLRGWWVSGIDPLTWQPMTWGRFKPDADKPVIDRAKNRPAKYLSPSLGRGSSRLILLRVPDSVWERVAQRYDQPLPVNREQGFWHWVWQQQIPVILTEGEKKAGCLLSLGYAAIALPGIFNGYRKEANQTSGQLIPELDVFATTGRSISICFDFETRPTTVKNLQLAITKLGQLLQTKGCLVEVVSLPGPQKGVDDFVVAQGATALHDLVATAVGLKVWQAQQAWRLTYPIALQLNQPYLGELAYPETGLVALKSPKGSGKTSALQPLIRQAIQTGRKVLVITHRIQLGRAICHSLGISWIEEILSSVSKSASRSEGHQTQSHPGYGLCIDSLHPDSQADFNPQLWHGAIVILDEVEQVLWHALNSATCYEHRVKILATLRELVQVVLSSNGLLIAQDADLSNVSLDYLTGLVEQPITPWLVVNQWQSQSWPCFLYQTPNPAALVARLTEVLQSGPVFVALDSQKAKGRWSSKNLERYLQSQFPQRRILRIDSETVADPTNPAYGIVERLDELVEYDVVLATPTIGTGISIEITGHFRAVFGIFQGVICDAESRQALARVREPVPRYIWAANFGPGKVGNGSCSYQDVIYSTTQQVKYNIALLKNIDFDIDQQTDPITLRTWAKMAARVNLSLWDFRQQISQGLKQEGHEITLITSDISQLSVSQAHPTTLYQDLASGSLQIPGYEFLDLNHSKAKVTEVLTEVTQARQQQQIQEALAVSEAIEIAPADYQTIKDQRRKTWEERCVIQKHELQHRYAVTVTPELKLKDDQGWFNQLQLHYYLTHDSAWVKLRDYKEWQGHLERGDGKIALQDVRLLTAQVEALKRLGILELLNSEREIRATDTDIQQIAAYGLQYHRDLKILFNLTVSERMTPIEIIQGLLNRLGLKLTCIRRDQASDGRRGGLRVYQYRPANDHRDTIFAQWYQRDLLELQLQLEAEQKDLGSKDPISTVKLPTLDPPPDIVGSNLSEVGSASTTPQTEIQSYSDSIPNLQPNLQPSLAKEYCPIAPLVSSA